MVKFIKNIFKKEESDLSPLDKKLKEISDRWNKNTERRQLFVFSDFPGHYWTKLSRPSDLTKEEREMIVK